MLLKRLCIVFSTTGLERYPWLSIRVIKGRYRDAVRRAKPFKKTRKKGRARKDKPEIRSITPIKG
ncbi:MAG: hypothetical protein QXQ57_02115 [Sulfolobales archaeon]